MPQIAIDAVRVFHTRLNPLEPLNLRFNVLRLCFVVLNVLRFIHRIVVELLSERSIDGGEIVDFGRIKALLLTLEAFDKLIIIVLNVNNES